MKKLLLLIVTLSYVVIFVCHTSCVHAQVQGFGISSSGAPPDPSAMIDVSSKNRGALIPRMTTTERNAIINPALGLLIFNTTTNCINMWLGSNWRQLCGECDFNIIAGNNGPVCEGQTLNLTASSIVGANYQWSGLNGFVSSQQNPSIPNVSLSAGGAYSVTATLNGCTAAPQNLFVTVFSRPAAPTAGPHISLPSQIVWKWDTVPGATGYKWNFTNDYNSAVDNGSNTSYAQTGLSCGSYTFYVWAYNSHCNSTSTTLTQSIPLAGGGIITSDGGRTIHTFTTSGTFTVNCTVTLTVDVLIVAGGGAGGVGGNAEGSGGGGAGGLIYLQAQQVTTGFYPITVGNGGTNSGNSGGNSQFQSYIAIGGGGGAGGSGPPAKTGGSGGGGGYGAVTGAAGTTGQGNAGGNYVGGSSYRGGGGGGASLAGSNGLGGDGLQYSIIGTPTYYAGGGGGGSYGGLGSAVGGLGGGGNGGDATSSGNGPGSPGAANTGGGGGGAGYLSSGGAGGSGVVIISY